MPLRAVGEIGPGSSRTQPACVRSAGTTLRGRITQSKSRLEHSHAYMRAIARSGIENLRASPQPKSGLPDFGHSFNWWKSDRSDFHWGEAWGEGVTQPARYAFRAEKSATSA